MFLNFKAAVDGAGIASTDWLKRKPFLGIPWLVGLCQQLRQKGRIMPQIVTQNVMNRDIKLDKPFEINAPTSTYSGILQRPCRLSELLRFRVRVLENLCRGK